MLKYSSCATNNHTHFERRKLHHQRSRPFLILTVCDTACMGRDDRNILLGVRALMLLIVLANQDADIIINLFLLVVPFSSRQTLELCVCD